MTQTGQCRRCGAPLPANGDKCEYCGCDLINTNDGDLSALDSRIMSDKSAGKVAIIMFAVFIMFIVIVIISFSVFNAHAPAANVWDELNADLQAGNGSHLPEFNREFVLIEPQIEGSDSEEKFDTQAIEDSSWDEEFNQIQERILAQIEEQERIRQEHERIHNEFINQW